MDPRLKHKKRKNKIILTKKGRKNIETKEGQKKKQTQKTKQSKTKTDITRKITTEGQFFLKWRIFQKTKKKP